MDSGFPYAPRWSRRKVSDTITTTLGEQTYILVFRDSSVPVGPTWPHEPNCIASGELRKPCSQTFPRMRRVEGARGCRAWFFGAARSIVRLCYLAHLARLRSRVRRRRSILCPLSRAFQRIADLVIMYSRS